MSDAESSSPAASQQKVRLFLGSGIPVGAAVLFIVGYFVASPYIALQGFRSALMSGEPDALEDRIDFPRVRDGLKAQFNATVMKNMSVELKNNPFGGLALAIAPTLVNGVVDSFVTAEGLASLARGNTHKTGSSTSGPSSEELSFDARVTWETLDRFSVRVPSDEGQEMRLVFHRYGFGWKLTGIRIPPM
jgi:hypothetical protein